MKTIKKLVALAVTAAFILTGCSNKGSGSADVVSYEDIPENTEVIFWHAMNGAQEEALTKITNDFMTKYPKIKITLQNQSSYTDLQTKLSATYASPSDLPTITQAYPGWVYAASEEGLLQDLKGYMNSDEIGFSDEDPLDDIIPGFLAATQMDGVTYGLPFTKSTDVLFYNETLFNELGLSLPTSMEDIATISKTVYEKKGIPGAGWDSLTNYFVTSLKNAGQDFTAKTDVTSDTVADFVNYYLDGIKGGYLRIAGSDKYMSGPFGNQQVAMYIGSSAGETYVKAGAEGKFTAKAMALPVTYNIQQGTDVYLFSSGSAEVKSAAFLYMRYLVSADVQLYWATNTGYLPVRKSVQESTAYKSKDSLITPIADEIVENYYTMPTSAQSNAAYLETGTYLEEVLSNPNTDVPASLQTLKTDLDRIWSE